MIYYPLFEGGVYLIIIFDSSETILVKWFHLVSGQTVSVQKILGQKEPSLKIYLSRIKLLRGEKLIIITLWQNVHMSACIQ